MKIILDTSFLIELKKGNKKAVEALEEQKEECEDIIVSMLTVYELLVGANYVWKKHGNAKEMIINDMLKFLTVVPVDLDVVKRASSVKAELMLRGMDVPDLDILIACSDEDAEILTFDKDFNPLKDLGFKISFLGDDE